MGVGASLGCLVGCDDVGGSELVAVGDEFVTML